MSSHDNLNLLKIAALFLLLIGLLPTASSAIDLTFENIAPSAMPATTITQQPYSYSDSTNCWQWQFLPSGLIYRPYMAGPKEPRFASTWVYKQNQGWLWDATLGGRVAIFRYGTTNPIWPQGWELGIEGAAFPRLDLEENRDLVSVDFRFGIPLTYRRGVWETKFSYYHLSSHLGDEFLLTHPGAKRINYARDAFVLGLALRPNDSIRYYAEADWAFYSDGGSDPWEFQFGIEYTPMLQCNLPGNPFVAVNGHLRQDVNFGGEFNLQAGWQWRGQTGRSLRTGLTYSNGQSSQYQFFNVHEELLGFGIWYDY